MNKIKGKMNPKCAIALADRIYAEFSVYAEIDLRLLISDNIGKLIYQGPPNGLLASALDSVLNDPGTYYLFRVTGKSAELVEPKLFGWISAPSPPRPVFVSRRAMKLRWNSLRLFGEYNTELLLDAVYILEGAQSTEFRPGVVSKYRTDLSGNEYKIICRGNDITEAYVTDLLASHWFNWRLTVEYAGVRFTSESRAVSTVAGPGPMPAQPSLVVKTNQTPGLFKRENKTTVLKFMWTGQPQVQPQIKKYQLQIEERCKLHMSVHGTEPRDVSVSPRQAHSCSCQSWRTAYSDVHSFYKCKPPSFGSAEWRVRVRSWNSCGWSAFSKPLEISYKTHADLFPAGFLSCDEIKIVQSPYLDSADSKYSDDEFELSDGAALEKKAEITSSERLFPPHIFIGISDEQEIKRLALIFHINENRAKEELSTFMEQFPPLHQREEGERNL